MVGVKQQVISGLTRETYPYPGQFLKNTGRCRPELKLEKSKTTIDGKQQE